MEVITDSGETLAIIHRATDWAPGLTFCTPDHLFLQVGCWHYPAGKTLRAHAHKTYPRVAHRTQEATLVLSGSMKVFLFNSRKEKVKEVVLSAGDFAVLANGGHGYEILEDDTRVFEVKNGPFASVEQDKELF
jgi:cupin fold WbuC family metalloprotein